MKTKILIITLVVMMVALSIGIGITDYKQSLVKDAKAGSVNYTTLEAENAKTKAVFKEELATDVARPLKIRKEGVTVKTVMSIGRDVNSKDIDLSRFKKVIGDGSNQRITLYVFPDEEIFFTNYDEAINHMIDNYDAGKTGSFLTTDILASHVVHVWPDNPDDDKMLRDAGYFPKAMDVPYAE